MISSWFKKVMTVVNCLFTVPVIWVVIAETIKPGPVNLGRIFATAALVAIPLAGTIAVTIAGSAVLKDD